MNLLLDTHTFIWAAKLPARLPPRIKALLTNSRNRRYLSAASIWEIATKHNLQKPNFVFPEKSVIAAVSDLGCEVLGVGVNHVLALYRLPTLHGDPFDRILLAQAWTENLILVTTDAQLKEYSEVQTIW